MATSLRLDWCSHEAAKYAVENWHYSEKLPIPPLVKIGVWEDGKFIGCVLFARGANRNIGAPYGLPMTEVCELVRVALCRHETPVSRIIAICMKFLAKQCPGLRLVVSYADLAQGHHGGIYQAGNWVYVGRMDSRPIYVSPGGKELHAREVSGIGANPAFGKNRKTVRIQDCKLLPQPGKHKYLMPLDPEMRARIAMLAKPYPKRAGSSDSGTSPIQGGGGGATPTPALSTKSGE